MARLLRTDSKGGIKGEFDLSDSALNIAKVQDRSDGNLGFYMCRVLVTFNNGHNISIIRGEHSHGGPEGLFEIMPSTMVGQITEDTDRVLGHLTAEEVQEYIALMGQLPAMGSAVTCEEKRMLAGGE